jgi:hypothetical protein
VPVTVQAPVVVLENDTGSPDVAVAANEIGGSVTNLAASVANVIVCGASVMLNALVTDGAAAYVASPGWAATILQEPTPTGVTVPLLTVQIEAGDVVVMATGSPEVADPATANGGVSTVFAGMVAKVIVCAIF